MGFSFSDSFKDITGMNNSSTGQFVSSVLDPLDLTGKKAEWAAEDATEASMSSQQAYLDYLREIDEMPREYRDASLAKLYDYYTSPQDQQSTIDSAKDSPIYAEIMGTKDAGEEALMRTAGATGGLRSGNIQSNLYDYNTQLEKEALTTAYNTQYAEEQDVLTGLKGLAQIPTYESEIGSTMTSIGDTASESIMGLAQSQQASTESAANLGMGILSMFI